VVPRRSAAHKTGVRGTGTGLRGGDADRGAPPPETDDRHVVQVVRQHDDRVQFRVRGRRRRGTGVRGRGHVAGGRAAVGPRTVPHGYATTEQEGRPAAAAAAPAAAAVRRGKSDQEKVQGSPAAGDGGDDDGITSAAT